MTTRDQIVEYVLGVGYNCRYDQVSGMVVVRTKDALLRDENGWISYHRGEDLVSVPADDYRAARELIDVVVGLEGCWGPYGLLQ
jgi:hypothetical protein